MIKPCTLIAAIDLNHNGQEVIATRLIDAAIACSCDAVKFRKCSLEGEKKNSQTLELSPEYFRRIREYTRGKILFIGAPFDKPSLEFLDQLDVDAIKIDPPHTLNLPLLEAVSRLKRKIMISLSFCTEENIKILINLFRGQDLVLVHEISMRPVRMEVAQLGLLAELQKYNLPFGYADRGDEFFPAVAARTLGASVIEKGLTLCRELPGPDHASSLEPDQMQRFVKEMRDLEKSLFCNGPRRIFPYELDRFDEEGICLVAKRDIRAGETITEEMISIKSPPRGLTPRLMKEILGKKALYDIQQDEPITFGLIDL